ncbi:MAG: hypothetical protein ABI402_21290, partial [Ferruginibacter sp.]
MKKEYTTAGVAARIWLLTSVVFAIGFGLVCLFNSTYQIFMSTGFALFASLIGSIPAFVVIITYFFLIKNIQLKWQTKFSRLLLIQFGITICYGLFAALIDIPMRIWFDGNSRFIYPLLYVTAILFACSCIASFIILKIIASYFSNGKITDISYSYTFSLLFQ